MQRVSVVCIPMRHVQEVSLSDILAFLALLKRILRLPLRHGSKSNGEDNIPLHGT